MEKKDLQDFRINLDETKKEVDYMLNEFLKITKQNSIVEFTFKNQDEYEIGKFTKFAIADFFNSLKPKTLKNDLNTRTKPEK